MLTIGCHLSSAKGFLAMGKQAVEIGANSFQCFTRNPRGGKAKPLDEKDITSYLAFASQHGLQPLLAHAPYTLNACAACEDLRIFARNIMVDDLSRLEHLPGSFYNFHPGSHVNQGVAAGIKYIAAMLNLVLQPCQKTTVLLETMAGKGSEIGKTFEELGAIIDLVKDNEHLGVCLDTCHVFDGGYDIRDNLESVLREFDQIIGLGRLKAIHLNDSMNCMGSRKDRHANIGNGKIGLDALACVMNHPALRDKPFYLETPADLDGHKQEILLLKSRRNEGA